MTVERLPRRNEVQDQPKESQGLGAELKERLFVLSLELSRRAVEAQSLEELGFFLTNDIRVLIEFDRCFLITHMRGQSRLVGASNQPVLNKKSKFDAQLNQLASRLKVLNKPLFVTSLSDLDRLSDDALTPELKEALVSYAQFSKCTGMVCIPLNHGDETLGHLLLEYLDGKVPDKIKIVALLKLAPFFAAALAERWVFTQNPQLVPLTQPYSWGRKPVVRILSRYVPGLAFLAAVLAVLLFFVPFSHTVGGEAEIAPRDRHVAFAKIDGLIGRINVVEGTVVTKGHVIATLDPTELDFKIQVTGRQLDLLIAEMKLLKRSSGQDVSKLAESKLVELKIKSAFAELQYLKWQRQFLDIQSPASGIITTKHVETFVGKKFKAGEPFCEIAVPSELWAEIYVPEDKVSHVKPGQKGDLYLNNQPRDGCPIEVQEVSPRAEAVPRLGNVYRVRAAFRSDSQPPVKVGMKAIGKIYTAKASLYSIITQRLYSRWNQFALHFL